MKVLIYSPYALSPSHHEFSLEMAKQHLEKGDEVHVLVCSGKIQTCDQNKEHERVRCLQCKSIGARTFEQIGISKENIHVLPETNSFQGQLKDSIFSSVNELQNFTWKGIPAGYAVCSSLVAMTRDTQPEIKNFTKFITDSLEAYCSVYEGVRKILTELKSEILYVFNGRTTLYHAAFQAARSLGKTVRVGERETENRYVIYENYHALELGELKRKFMESLEEIKKIPNWEETARTWYENSSKGKCDFSSNYLSHQLAGNLPENFKKDRFNIVIFCSSEDELVIEPSLKSDLFETQNEGVKFILDNLKDPKIFVYLRVHPNLRGLDVTQTRETKLFKHDRFVTIPAEATVDSYALLDVADLVITFGSTVSVEAVYRNKPVVLLGKNIFEDLGVFYIPKTRGELLKLVSGPLKPLPPDKVLLYGYWRATRGEKFRFITTQNPHIGNPSLFKGQKLFVPGFYVRLVLKLIRDFNRVLHWTFRSSGKASS